MRNTLKYITVMAACALFAGYTAAQSVSDIRGSSRSVALVNDKGSPIFVTEIPPGYRDWRFISVAHEEGDLNDIRAILGNDVAINAYREGKLPFPEGTIIARIAWDYVPSEENNKVFGRARPGTFSLWSRTQRSTPRRAAGGSLNLIRKASPPTRRRSTPAMPATRR
jgi:hypothetical protein